MKTWRSWADIDLTRRISRWLDRFGRIAWAALLFSLPVTSFPFFPPALGGEALVRPLSIYPLIPLLVLVILPRLLTQPIPRAISTLIPVVLVAAASSLLSLMRGIEPALGISVEARVLRGMITLLIGCAYYVVIAVLPRTIEDLRFSLRWIYAGGCAALAWGSLQAAAILISSQRLFAFLEKAQTFISIRPLNPERAPGLTYEPHWFAEQIILLILPWTLAAILNNYTVFRHRWGRLTGEMLVLGWALVVLPFTFSRSGLLNLVVVVFLGVIFFRPQPQKPAEENSQSGSGLWKFARRRTLEAALAALLVLGPIYAVGSNNVFFARVWDYWRQPGATLQGYLTYLGFDARMVYAQAAYNTYLRYPVLGVGVGNYAFYFEEMLPDRPLSDLPEILLMITPEPGRDRLITSKNFYLRLLGETGIVGAVAFLAFFIANLGGALYLWLGRSREERYWGTASLCGLLAFSLSAMTFDSFVIPNTWLVFGLITAATRVIMHCSLSEAQTAPAGALLFQAPPVPLTPEALPDGDPS
jgi:hypothetical protein